MRICLGVFLVSFILIGSCSEKDQVPPDLGLNYYPLRVGNYLIYQVEETTISQSGKQELSYELKVTVTDSSFNEQGELTYLLVREKRVSPTDSWESLDTWSTKLAINKLVQNESNVSFVKLVFPPSLNLKWDGNQYNNLPYNGGIDSFYDGNDRPYFISELDEPISLSNGFAADHTLTVIQNEYNDIITGRDERKEVYAREVGMIYKEINQFIKCNGTGCAGDASYVFIQRLKENGKI